jgi:tetratricopeptide (TPR) repeat protein
MARLNNPNDPDAAQKLQKAEDYAKKAIQLTPTLPKPKEVSDPDFQAVSNQTLSEAHSALGLINVRRANYDAAIPDLEEAAKLDGGKDITNYYLLGVAYANSSHYAEAVEAFNKCAASPGNLQQPCQNGAAEAQKHVTSK